MINYLDFFKFLGHYRSDYELS